MKNYKRTSQNDRRVLPVIIIIAVLLVLAMGSYALYRHHQQSADKTGGSWTYLGTATELGGTSNMATYACVDKASSNNWVVEAKASLSPASSDTNNYTFTLTVWPFKSITAVPGGQSEIPRGQVKSNSWTNNQQTTIQLNVTPSEKNYIQVTAVSKGHGGKILPSPFNNPPLASQLANC